MQRSIPITTGARKSVPLPLLRANVPQTDVSGSFLATSLIPPRNALLCTVLPCPVHERDRGATRQGYGSHHAACQITCHSRASGSSLCHVETQRLRASVICNLPATSLRRDVELRAAHAAFAVGIPGVVIPGTRGGGRDGASLRVVCWPTVIWRRAGHWRGAGGLHCGPWRASPDGTQMVTAAPCRRELLGLARPVSVFGAEGAMDSRGQGATPAVRGAE
ncbi:unnamed protein product [Lampetra planeri]